MSKNRNSKKGWIVLVGGGTGGHVVPIKNVAMQLLKSSSDSKILVITSSGYVSRTEQIFNELIKEYGSRIKMRGIHGGRFRRYARSKWRELLDIKTQLLNFRDIFISIYGYLQSKLIIRKFRPEVIFCKGGTGALEYCFAARKIAPIIVHDSDSRPGLANKTVSRWAVKVLTGMPKSSNLEEDSNLVGIPVDEGFSTFSSKRKASARDLLDLDQKSKTILVTGGSLGAKKINELIFCTINDLNKLGIQVLHQTGSAEATKRAKEIKKTLGSPHLYKPFDFTTQIPEMYEASDLVVSRAGASAIQELANSAKPAIIIPAALTDQQKNGRIIDELGAGLVADQNILLEHPEEFISEVQFILSDERRQNDLSEGISRLAKPTSAAVIAKEILDIRDAKDTQIDKITKD